jgi:hypothetical protein
MKIKGRGKGRERRRRRESEEEEEKKLFSSIVVLPQKQCAICAQRNTKRCSRRLSPLSHFVYLSIIDTREKEEEEKKEKREQKKRKRRERSLSLCLSADTQKRGSGLPGDGKRKRGVWARLSRGCEGGAPRRPPQILSEGCLKRQVESVEHRLVGGSITMVDDISVLQA